MGNIFIPEKIPWTTNRGPSFQDAHLMATVLWTIHRWTINPPNLGQLIAIIAIFRVWVPITGTSLAPVARDEDRWKNANFFLVAWEIGKWAKRPFPTFIHPRTIFRHWQFFGGKKLNLLGFFFWGELCFFRIEETLFQKWWIGPHKNAKKLHIICLQYKISHGLDFFMWAFLASTEAKTRSELQKLGNLEVEKWLADFRWHGWNNPHITWGRISSPTNPRNNQGGRFFLLLKCRFLRPDFPGVPGRRRFQVE